MRSFIVILCILSTALWPTLGAEERTVTPRPTRAPALSPRNNKPLPSPGAKPTPPVAPAPKSNNISNQKTKWEYMLVEEGMSFISEGELNAALKAKISLMGANGWELVTVYNEGAQKVFIYKRQL
jgi:hypothetical protein